MALLDEYTVRQLESTAFFQVLRAFTANNRMNFVSCERDAAAKPSNRFPGSEKLALVGV